MGRGTVVMGASRARAALGVLVGLLGVGAGSARADLFEYVKKPDKVFSWTHKSTVDLKDGTMYHLLLVSQEWQGVKWEHDIQLFIPKGIDSNGSMFLWNQGGKPGVASAVFGMDLALRMKAPVALLFGIPNQPLLEGKFSEDALIAETFVRYLKTKDGDWPLLFPMVKSLVRAMDALQEFCKKELKLNITRFVVSGASKRGWTTWLTGAADARVQAIAPAVIDTLNFQKQIPHQLESFGTFSDMIKDYTRRGLVPIPDTEEARKLWRMIDPWHYRDKLKMPTMIINGANDPYWTTDALNLYWDDLKCPRWVLYVPNAGHNLTQEQADGKKDRNRSLSTLAAFVHCQIYKKEMPTLTWKHRDLDGKLVLDVEASVAPKAARLWVAQGPTRDLRKAKWEERPATAKGGTIRGAVAAPASGVLATYAELEYEMNGQPYYLSTQMRVVGK
ncbi:MAG: PhoPQ-activated protein PqaA family protein [Gemmataceae bacterium]